MDAGNEDQTEHPADISPVGWYVGSYQLRFVELDEPGNDNDDAGFLVWENTIIVRARNLDEAFQKVEENGRLGTKPYRGGPDAVPVQWVYEGITSLLPIYEALEDGAEIIWEEHDSVVLRDLRARAKTLAGIREEFRAERAKAAAEEESWNAAGDAAEGSP